MKPLIPVSKPLPLSVSTAQNRKEYCKALQKTKTAKPTSPIQQATYEAALQLVGQIDRALSTGLYHYRTTSGRLLTSLDEVIRAILDDSLLLEKPAHQSSGQD